MRVILISVFIGLMTYALSAQSGNIQNAEVSNDTLKTWLAEIWKAEQDPLRLRDSIGREFGFKSEEFNKQQAICDINHAINEKKIKHLLDTYGWPRFQCIGDRGNLTICNVLQHSSLEVRLKYLPMMKKAVGEVGLPPRLLARAEDRIATDRNELQIYGGQMKYYPETNSFNVWPVYDPINIDIRRALIGLGPIAEHLQDRFNFTWDLDKQLKRTSEFIKKRNSE